MSKSIINATIWIIGQGQVLIKKKNSIEYAYRVWLTSVMPRVWVEPELLIWHLVPEGDSKPRYEAAQLEGWRGISAGVCKHQLQTSGPGNPQPEC